MTTRPNSHIALIYHYDLARALAGEVVDWQAIPVNVDAGREGGDLCRAAADFAKRRDLFAMPAPTKDYSIGPIRPGPDVVAVDEWGMGVIKSAVPVGPNPTVEQQAADPEPALASCPVPGAAVTCPRCGGAGEGYKVVGDRCPDCAPYNRDRLRARIKDLVDQGHETLIRQFWSEGVPTLKHDGHSDAQLQLILACVRRVEAEVGAGWHPDDGPPPHINTNPRASVDYPKVDEGGLVSDDDMVVLDQSYQKLSMAGQELCRQVAIEAHQAGRVISAHASRSVRRWSIARAVIAWAASGRTLDELWFAASNLATFEQCRDPSATLGGLISQFTIEQADRLYDAAQTK